MICNVCGYNNNHGDKFCCKCGAKLECKCIDTRSNPSWASSTAVLCLAVAILALAVVLFVSFGLPLLRQSKTDVSIPDNTVAPTLEGRSSATNDAVPTPTESALTVFPGRLDSTKNYRQISCSDIYASSELVYNGQRFYASNAIDGTIDTSWQEADAGDGSGEYLHMTFSGLEDIDFVRIRPGYGQNEKGYWNNNRVCDALFEFSDGTSFIYTFPDSYDYFTLELSKTVRTSSMRIIILSVYLGKVYNDAVISEIALYSKT